MAQTTWREERDAPFVAGNTVIILISLGRHGPARDPSRVMVMLGQRIYTLLRLSGRHVMPDERAVVGGMVAHNAGGGDESMHCRRDGRMQVRDREDGRFSPTDQRQRTLQLSRLYLVTVAVTTGVKWTLQRQVMVVIFNSPQ